MKVDILFPALPPALDGIGDHTACFARTLTSFADVRILTAEENAEAIPGVAIEQALSLSPRSGVMQALDILTADPPDVLLVEFNQFSYGRWGLNPYLPRLLRSVKKQAPSVLLAWMAHEDIVPGVSWKNRIMRLWQKRQFKQIGDVADVLFFSIEPWVKQYAPWFPGKPIHHLPVGSNMPHVGVSAAEARARIGLSPDAFVVGMFGTMHASRMLPLVRRSVESLQARIPDRLQVLHIGPDGCAVREAFGSSLPVLDAGRLPAKDVSVHLSATDLFLAPFIDGVSARRGSVLAALQHGLPVVTTRGPLTDPLFRKADGTSLFLAPIDRPETFVEQVLTALENPGRRALIGRAARNLYETQLSFDVAVRTFLHACQASHEHHRSDALV